MTFDNWKPRCHMLGKLMTAPKGKSWLDRYNEADNSYRTKFKEYKELANKETVSANKLLESCLSFKKKRDEAEQKKHIPNLSVGCITTLQEIHTSLTTGRRKFVKSKYFDKGLTVEEDCITMYSMITADYNQKNTIQKENDWVIGCVDFKHNGYVVDTKAAWDIWTFNKARYSKISPLYQWQLDGYMWLEDLQEAKLAYCLINTPEYLIKIEEKKLMYDLFGSESNFLYADDYMKDVYEQECILLRKNHIFDDLNIRDKIKIFEVKRDESRIDRIKYVVEGSRWFLNNINEIENTEQNEEE
jgi:hypothetical protein